METSIDFSTERWSRVKKDYTAWWRGELDRPLVSICTGGREPGRSKPALTGYGYLSFYDLKVPAEDIVDVIDYSLAQQRFLGDAFPSVWPNFGPGVVAAFMGARLENGKDTVWFHPSGKKEIADIHFPAQVDEGNVWFRRVSDIYRAAVSRWGGQVQLGMTDLGGNLDIVSSFRTGENLLMDLYDNPGEVKRLAWEAHNSWWAHFEALNRILQPVNPGYTAWTPIFSSEPYYILQCDFAYMIGPGMFDEFVRPELVATCHRLKNAFYHLDGVGQLPHLDSLLAIEDLKGVQWIPGSGQKSYEEWPDVYKKIIEAGKLVHLCNGDGPQGWRVIEKLADKLGSAKGIILIGWASPEDEKDVRRMLDRLGVPCAS